MVKPIEIEDKVHARLSPSGSKRWMTCPGSISFVESLNIKEYPSSYAAEGTVAHEVHEKVLTNGNDAADYIGEKMVADGFTFTVTESMAEAVQESVNYIRKSIDEAEALGYTVELKVEVRASLEYLGVPGLDGGTSDVVILVWDGDELAEVEIVDYKHGAGVPVEAEGNTQALCYALGTVHPIAEHCTDETVVRVTITQPRARHFRGPIRSWETSLQELKQWQDEKLVPAAKLTREPDAPLVPSDAGCRFCVAAGQCPALYKRTQEVAIADFAEDKFPSPETMTVDQKKTVLAHADMIRAFITAVEAQVKLEMDQGSQDYSKEYKLVHRTVHRRLTDEAKDPQFSPFYDWLKPEELYESKIRSLGDIEKALKTKMKASEVKEVMERMTFKPDPETVVAPINDRRKAVEPSVISDFTGIGD